MVEALPAYCGTEPMSSDRRFQLFVDAVRDYAIYMLDPSGIVSSWNSGAERFKGYKAHEIIGQHFSRFYTEEDRLAGVPQQAIAIAAAEGKYETEGCRVRKDGSHFWASVVIDAVRDADGNLVGFAKITRDITERRDTQKALDEAREALFQSQKMEALGQLTGGVAHDFNNLLQAIGGSLEVVEQRLAAGRINVEQHVAAARTAVGRATILTQRLLAFSRRQPLKPELTNLNALAPGMNDLIQKSVGDGVQVRMVLAPGLWTTWADANQIESALLNLALNSRDAMPQGGLLVFETANVVLSEAYVAAEPDLKPGEYVMLAVTDTGTGMARDVLGRAFEPFFTTKPIGQGTGLGLSQLYGFARQSGGHVRIDSEVGIGTSVKLYLPRHDMPIQDAEWAALGIAAAPAPQPRTTKSVLVVEDEAIVRMLLVQTLEDEGYTVLSAENGNVALEIVASPAAIDLLATDVGLPGINGRQLCEMARTLRPGLGVLYLTGYAYSAAITAEGMGANTQLLSKPVTMTMFCAKVHEMLQAL